MLAFTLVLALASIPAGVYAVFFTNISQNTTASTVGQPYLWIGPVPYLLPFGVTYGEAFLFCTLVYSAMFALLALQGRSAPAAARDGVWGKASDLLSSRLFLGVVSIGFLVFSASMVDLAVEALGGTVGNPLAAIDPLKELVQLTIAPLREEFGFRVLIIGLVALVLSAGKPVREALTSLWRPSAAYEGVAVGGAFIIVWMATAASSVMFGVCHVACGSGWDLGKLPEATYGGVVLGYLYVKYGFHVAVLAHWGIDYFGSIYAFVGQGLYGIPWTSDPPGYLPQLVVSTDLIFLFGIASFLFVAYVGLTRLFESWRSTGAVDTSYPSPQVVGEGSK